MLTQVTIKMEPYLDKDVYQVSVFYLYYKIDSFNKSLNKEPFLILNYF